MYGIEVFHDSSTDLVAVGLKNSIVIYQISINETNPAAEKLQSQVIQAVSEDKHMYDLYYDFPC